jgi:hypothetical protein
MPPLHNKAFMPSPDTFPIGVKYFATAACKLLEKYGNQ